MKKLLIFILLISVMVSSGCNSIKELVNEEDTSRNESVKKYTITEIHGVVRKSGIDASGITVELNGVKQLTTERDGSYVIKNFPKSSTQITVLTLTFKTKDEHLEKEITIEVPNEDEYTYIYQVESVKLTHIDSFPFEGDNFPYPNILSFFNQWGVTKNVLVITFDESNLSQIDRCEIVKLGKVYDEITQEDFYKLPGSSVYETCWSDPEPNPEFLTFSYIIRVFDIDGRRRTTSYLYFAPPPSL